MVVETGQSWNSPHGETLAPHGQAAAPGVTSSREAQISKARWEAIVRVCAQATPALETLMKDFWGQPLTLRLMSVSAKDHYFWRTDDYHVSQLQLGEAGMALLRLSDTMCAGFLNRVLGTRATDFSFRQLSPFEATLLNEFSKELFASLVKSVIRRGKNQASQRPAGGKPPEIHLVWAMQLEEIPQRMTLGPKYLKSRKDEAPSVGKLVLSLPLPSVAVPPPAENAEALEIGDDFFFHVETTARIRLGATRMPLADLSNLEPGDLVVFDDSSTERMWLIEPETETPLPFTPEIGNREYLEVPYTQDIATMQEQMMDYEMQQQARQNLWDNLMIEVGAEFEPVKLPLKQLKQMSEGLIIEMGDLVNNQVALHVDGKTLATGELIIVGDKFGVRISHVEAANGPAPGPQETPAQLPEQAQSAPQAPQAQPGEHDEASMQALAAMGAGAGAIDPLPAGDSDDDFLDSDFDDDAFDGEDNW